MTESLLERLYDHAVDGLPVLGTPQDVVRFATQPHASVDPPISEWSAEDRFVLSRDVIRQYMAITGTTGFLLGLPGYLTMPLTLPTNVVGVTVLQLHMAAAVAVLVGLDPLDPSVRIDCIRCVTGEAMPKAESSTRLLGGRAVDKLKERGGRFAAERIARLVGRGAKGLPLLGGAIGAVADVSSTRNVASRALMRFAPGGAKRA